MPYSFTKIEEDKTRTIGLVFTFLIFFYFITIWLMVFAVSNYTGFHSNNGGIYHDRTPFLLSPRDTLTLLFVAFVVGLIHWAYTTHGLIDKLIGVLGAEPLNLDDSYHKMFRNILDEVSVATGGVQIEGIVIPTMAMNAFALADFNGRNVIGITEGVLARLNRAQIEAIVGHEAAHIVSKDCLATTVTSSLFELYSGMLKGLELLIRGGSRSTRHRSRSSGRGGGQLMVAIVLIYLILMLTRFLSYLVRMFISRQREFRADAIAVRLTRDPLSLAEALYAIGYHWRGQGLTAEELEAIFIINPKYAHLDEEEGLLADWFATHPPLDKRIGVLLNMAHAEVKEIVANVRKLDNKPKTTVPQAEGSREQWMVQHEGAWRGPYDLVQMATFGWMTPDTWIKRIGTDDVRMAHQDQRLLKMVSAGSQEQGAATRKDHCPKCRLPLSQTEYEGVQLKKCSFCHGVLVHTKDIQRIIIRQDVEFPERVKKIAQGLKEEMDNYVVKKIDRDPKTLLTCPVCNHPRAKMHRTFYTEMYRVEIDRCISCCNVWFDPDELEVLQCMIENATAKT